MRVPEAVSQRWMSRSCAPEARILPSGLKATRMTVSECARRVCTGTPVSAFQTMMSLSAPPEARVFPSGAKSTVQTIDVWPWKTRSGRLLRDEAKK